MRRNFRGIRLKGLKVSGRWPSGNPRLYYRTPVGMSDIPLPDAPKDSAEFLKAYAAAAEGRQIGNPRAQHRTGSIGAAVRAFMASDHFLTRAPSTRAVWRRMLEDIEAKYAKGRLADLQTRHIRMDLAKLPPHPANNRLKVWRALCRWSVDAALIETDPARDVRPKAAPRSDGHTPWAKDDVAAFRAAWPIGTPQRLALELMLHTGAAIGDAVRLGPANMQIGWLTYRRAKSGTVCTCPVTAPWPAYFPGSPHLPDCIAAAPRGLTYLCTPRGHPRSPKSATQWFSKAARAAGIDAGKTAHGLRKYLAVTMTERGATPEQRMAILGHDTTRQTQEYSKTADARRIISGTDFDNLSDQVVKSGQKRN